MIINLHIERLIVDDLGYGPTGRAQLADAVRDHLSRMLATGELQPRFRTGTGHYKVQGGVFSLGNTDRAATAGQGIARAVYRGIGEPTGEAGPHIGGGSRP